MKYVMTFLGVVALVLATGFTSLPMAKIQAISDTQPVVVLSPTSGPQGSTVQVSVSGFPANTPVQIGLHKPGRKLLEVTKDATTNSNGDVSVSMNIPTFTNEESNEQWLAKVSTTSGASVTASSNIFNIRESNGEQESNETGQTGVTTTVINYVVQPGVTLSTIAQRYGTTVNAIMALNPQITNSEVIYSGEVLRIPVGQVVVSPIIPITGVSVVLTPASGLPGSSVEVIVSGFPAHTPITIQLHTPGYTQVGPTQNVTTNTGGQAVVHMNIPNSVNESNETWLAQVTTTSGTSLTASSNEFVVLENGEPVTPIVAQPGEIINYVIQPGDNLSTLTVEYNTSVNAILALNPQITNPSLIYSGQVIRIPVGTTTVSPSVIIPSTGPSAVITPNSGLPGSNVDVIVSGFPANTPISLGLHKLNRKLIESHATATTDAYGAATMTMRIPTGSNINNNRYWLAQVSTTSGPSLTVTSNQFDVTRQ